jgi:Tfp pilus assembly protein FimV
MLPLLFLLVPAPSAGQHCLQDLDKLGSELRAEVAVMLEQGRAKMEARLEEKDAEAEEMKARLEEKDAKLEALETSMSEMKAELEERGAYKER